MTTETIDRVFGAGSPATTEITITKAADLIRAAVSKAVADGVPAETTRAVAKRAYHLAKALTTAMDVEGEAEAVTVDQVLLEALEADAVDAVVKGSMSEAMERLSKAIGVPAPTPDTGGEPQADADATTEPRGEVAWPSDLNTAQDPNGLDDWGKDPDLARA